jgi:hypothetical protein
MTSRRAFFSVGVIKGVGKRSRRTFWNSISGGMRDGVGKLAWFSTWSFTDKQASVDSVMGGVNEKKDPEEKGMIPRIAATPTHVGSNDFIGVSESESTNNCFRKFRERAGDLVSTTFQDESWGRRWDRRVRMTSRRAFFSVKVMKGVGKRSRRTFWNSISGGVRDGVGKLAGFSIWCFTDKLTSVVSVMGGFTFVTNFSLCESSGVWMAGSSIIFCFRQRY